MLKHYEKVELDDEEYPLPLKDRNAKNLFKFKITFSYCMVITSFGQGKFASYCYHESNLSLIAQEFIRLLINHELITDSNAPENKHLLINHHLILIRIQPKSICLEKSCYERYHGIIITSLYCLLFIALKGKHLKKIS